MTTLALMLTADIDSWSRPRGTWGFLQTQRRDVCTALLAESLKANQPDKGIRESLQMRLRQIDDGLDKLFDNHSSKRAGKRQLTIH